MTILVALTICAFMIWQAVKIGSAVAKGEWSRAQMHAAIFLAQGVLLGLIYRLG